MRAMLQNLDSELAPLRTAQRVLLADSDPLFLRGIHVSLDGEFDVEAEVTTSEECLASAPNAEILVMGFSLACGRNALGLLPDLRLCHCNLCVIVILSPTTGWMAPRLLAAGAISSSNREATSWSSTGRIFRSPQQKSQNSSSRGTPQFGG